MDESESKTQVETKSRLRRTAENQIVGRGTKKLGGLLVARGAYYASNEAIYDVTYRHHAARYNVQGTRIVGAHTQKTIEMRRTQGGRNFVATQTRKNPYGRPHHVHMGNKMVAYGRIIPVIGLGYVMYNTLSGPGQQPEVREGEGWGPMMAAYAAADIGDHYRGGGTTLRLLTGGQFGVDSIMSMKKPAFLESLT